MKLPNLHSVNNQHFRFESDCISIKKFDEIQLIRFGNHFDVNSFALICGCYVITFDRRVCWINCFLYVKYWMPPHTNHEVYSFHVSDVLIITHFIEYHSSNSNSVSETDVNVQNQSDLSLVSFALMRFDKVLFQLHHNSARAQSNHEPHFGVQQNPIRQLMKIHELWNAPDEIEFLFKFSGNLHRKSANNISLEILIVIFGSVKSISFCANNTISKSS